MIPLSPVPLLLPKDCAGQREEETGDLLDRHRSAPGTSPGTAVALLDQQRLMPEGDIALGTPPRRGRARGRKAGIELIRRKVASLFASLDGLHPRVPNTPRRIEDPFGTDPIREKYTARRFGRSLSDTGRGLRSAR